MVRVCELVVRGHAADAGADLDGLAVVGRGERTGCDDHRRVLADRAVGSKFRLRAPTR